ncbi:MAG: ribose-phosphate diphosphokinase [bacterium]
MVEKDPYLPIEGTKGLDKHIVPITGSANGPLSRSICEILGLDSHLQYPVERFADGEAKIQIPENLRNRNVVIIQPTNYPQGENYTEIFLLANDVRVSAGERITAVIPYFGYARQDRRVQAREPESASVFVKLLRDTVDRIITVDLHSLQIKGGFGGPWDNIPAASVLLEGVVDMLGSQCTIISPDLGGQGRAADFMDIIDKDDIQLAVISKRRDKKTKNESSILGMSMGEVKDRDCVIIDDIIDTAGTIVNAANYIHRQGAKSIQVAATHGLFSRNALQLINDSPIDRIVITDTVFQLQDVLNNPKIKIVSVAPLLARAILSNHTGRSLSEDPFIFPKPKMGG